MEGYMFNDLFSGVAGLAFVVLAVLVFWKYSQIWAVNVATKIIKNYFDQKRATSSEAQVS